MYNLKIVKSGNRIEIYKINDYIVNEGKKSEAYKDIEALLTGEKDSSHCDDKEDNDIRKKTLNKARNNIIRLIKCNADMSTFITLTFKVEQDYKESKKSLNILFTKLRRDYPGFKYIWILEYGTKNNRLHYHLLCNMPVTIKLSDSKHLKSEEHKNFENNFALKYWPYGFIDIRQLEQESNTNVALYVSTYIVKSLQDVNLEGYRVYSYSKKTLNKPIIIKLFIRDSLEKILGQFSDYEITFSNSYQIGYKDLNNNRCGVVIYLDLNLRGGNDENK